MSPSSSEVLRFECAHLHLRSRLLWRARAPAIRVTQPREWRRELHPSSEDRRHGAVTSETVAFFDTPLPDMGAAAAEAWGIHNWSPQR
jgi:hypothetical protein